MVFCNLKVKNHHQYNSFVTILILIDGFLQFSGVVQSGDVGQVTILILIDGFLQLGTNSKTGDNVVNVTILILIDGFLQ